MKFCSALLISFLVAGCAANPDLGSLSADELARISRMELTQGPAERPHTVLDTVSGLSCHRNAYQDEDITREEALEGVKIEAATIGADAVVSISCQTKSGPDMRNNCWSSYVCAGVAVKFD